MLQIEAGVCYADTHGRSRRVERSSNKTRDLGASLKDEEI